MKIELKKLKIAEHMSEETTAFTADIFVDGKEAGYAKNDGHGGCTFYHANEGKRSLIEAAEKYCLTLPDQKFDMGGGRDPFVMKMNLENFIDELINAELVKKEEKKLEKKMATRLMYGSPKKVGQYYEINFKQPLSIVPLPLLQQYVDKCKSQMKAGEVFWNTNLEVLGVKL